MENMNQTIKNVLLLGVACLFTVVFWVIYESYKSSSLMEKALDPDLSIERGFAEAEKEFKNNEARFKAGGTIVSSLTKKEKEKYEEYLPLNYFSCGFGYSPDPIWLEIEKYEHNEHYIQAYNQRLKTLLEKSI